MSRKITFTNTLDYDLEQPKSASKWVPEWYSTMESYKNNKKIANSFGTGLGTIKKCMPVFDAITAGYIIVTPVDLYIGPDGTMSWPSANFITFHEEWQAPDHPLYNGRLYPKFNNPWIIKTPKGYSSLFVQPFHRKSIFTIMPGIVDTDTYFGLINFPFVLNDLSFTGIVPKGTPIVQVIPFKRENWESKAGTEKDKEQSMQQQKEARSTFYDYYKRMWHRKKQYK
jgi:hypothetical protein